MLVHEQVEDRKNIVLVSGKFSNVSLMIRVWLREVVLTEAAHGEQPVSLSKRGLCALE